MSNPLVHAERAARKWGGVPADYLPVHQFFDSTKAHVPDNRHRLILHNSFGIAVAEQVFGLAITNTAGCRVFVREIGQQHVLEDLGTIPTLADCLQEVSIRPWMAGAHKLVSDTIAAGSEGSHMPPDETTDPPAENPDP